LATDWHKRGWVLRQYDVGKWLGGAKSVYSRTSGYGSIINFLSINVILWKTVVEAFVAQNLPWVTYPMFLAVFVVAFFVVAIMDFKVILPSDYLFGMWQSWNHPKNPHRIVIEEILTILKEKEKK